jgi:hypothetical protein
MACAFGFPTGFIDWSIVDPEKPTTDPTREMNFKTFFPPTDGNASDIACSGHMWLPDGAHLSARSPGTCGCSERALGYSSSFATVAKTSSACR